MSTFIGSGLRVNQSSVNNNNQLVGRCAGGQLAGANNILFGCTAGACSTQGQVNVNIGNRSGCANSFGSANVMVGNDSGRCTTTGTFNVFMGAGAAINHTTGVNNIVIGQLSGQTGGNPSGLVNLTTQSNRIVIGNNNHLAFFAYRIGVPWTTVSDTRNKCIYGAVEKGLGFLQGITPIEYQNKDRETNEINDPLHQRNYGFSAQEILALEGDNPVIVSADDPDLLQITSDHLLPVMVNAIKELAGRVQSLKQQLQTSEESST